MHVRKLGWVHERIGVTRDEPHRHATTTRSVRQPDSGAMLGEAWSSAVRILLSART